MSERDQDFEDARRGFIAALDPGRIEAPDGRMVWDSDAYDFLAGDRPETATPSLWRQSRLTAIQGLFEIGPRFFQVRGLDLSNMEI
jgi:linear primary-alkylsulfatase